MSGALGSTWWTFPNSPPEGGLFPILLEALAAGHIESLHIYHDKPAERAPGSLLFSLSISGGMGQRHWANGQGQNLEEALARAASMWNKGPEARGEWAPHRAVSGAPVGRGDAGPAITSLDDLGL